MAHKIKLIGIILIVGIVLGLSFLISYNKPKNFDCNNVIFLRPSEISQASIIQKKTNALIIIPEKNEVIGGMDFLKNCPNANFLNYLGIKKKGNLQNELNNLENNNFDGKYYLEVTK